MEPRPVTRPVIGYRVWEVGFADSQTRVILLPHQISRSVQSAWEPEEAAFAMPPGAPVFRSRCWAYEHRAPQRECRCGFYVAATPQAAMEWCRRESGGVWAIGLAALGGHVIEHEAGARGEFAMILALHSRFYCAACRRFVDDAHVPVRPLWWETPHCPRCCERRAGAVCLPLSPVELAELYRAEVVDIEEG